MKKNLFVSLITSLLVTACGGSLDSTSSEDLESLALGGKDEILAEGSSNAPIIKRAEIILTESAELKEAFLSLEFIDKSTDELGFYINLHYGKNCGDVSDEIFTYQATQDQLIGFNQKRSGQRVVTQKPYFIEENGYIGAPETDWFYSKSPFYDAWVDASCEINVTVEAEFCNFWEGSSCPNKTRYETSESFKVSARLSE